MMELVSARVIGEQHGMNERTVLDWARKGKIPSVEHGKQTRFDAAAVGDALAACAVPEGMRRCSLCRNDQPADQFPLKGDRRNGKIYRCSQCYTCRRELKREGRRREAKKSGRAFLSREEQREVMAVREAEKARVKAEQAKEREAQREISRNDRQGLRAEWEAERARKVQEKARLDVKRRAAMPGITVANREKLIMSTLAHDDLVKLRARFWANASAQPSGCMEWDGRRCKKGYGEFEVYLDGKKMRIRAHRMAQQFANGDIPDDLLVLHQCDNPCCVNPEHLFLGTHQDNMADMVAKGRASREGGGSRENLRKTQCPKCGGPLTESPHRSQRTKSGKGRRRCAPCKKAWQAEYMRQYRKRYVGG